LPGWQMKQIGALALPLRICFGAAAVGGIATTSSPALYPTLVRPTWAPPASAFGPVWSVLCTVKALAAWLGWRAGATHRVCPALTLFLAQLVLNALWTWLFFAWRLGVVAGIEIVVLLVLIVLTIVAFWRIRTLAGVLMLPYAAWVTYATALTFALVQQNPGIL